ncbi:ras family protein, partial [Cystoisospora suis]
RGLWRELSVGGFSKPPGVYGHSMRAWNDKILLFGGLTSSPAYQPHEGEKEKDMSSPSSSRDVP